ncbi:hypothetical protein OAF80_00235 [bacterium]|jgi:hypothetical protein|nr:hypothetical protein [bacterium]
MCASYRPINRDDLPVSASFIWGKLFDDIYNNDLNSADITLTHFEFIIINGCEYQSQRFDSLSVYSVSKEKLVNEITYLILSSILIELEKLPNISSATIRKSKILDLYEELVSIQFELKTTDLNAYKSSFNLIKNLHQNCSNADRMATLIAENEIFISSVQIPCKW